MKNYYKNLNKPMKTKLYPDKTLLVLDQGLFVEFALKLADDFKKVYYALTWEGSYPGMPLAAIGKEYKNGVELDTFDGKNFKRVSSPFDVIGEVDCVLATDLYYGSMVEVLKNSGIPCFGLGKGEKLELDRLYAAEQLKKVGLDAPEMKPIIGLDNLREYLKEETEEKYIKISCYRQTFETFKHETYECTEPILDNIAITLGPLKTIAEFIVCDSIDAIVEEGVDTYCVNGQLPSRMMQGCEIKDQGYICAMVDAKDLSKGNKEVNDGLSKILTNHNSSGFFSTEVRTTKDDKHYMIDLCCRLGLPPNAIMQEFYSNLAEIVWQGANGHLVDPTTDYKYGFEVLISTAWHAGNHQTIYFPPEIRQYIKLINCVKIDDVYHIMKIGDSTSIGSLVYPCNDIEEGKAKILEMAEKIKGYDLIIKTDALDTAVTEFNKIQTK